MTSQVSLKPQRRDYGLQSQLRCFRLTGAASRAPRPPAACPRAPPALGRKTLPCFLVFVLLRRRLKTGTRSALFALLYASFAGVAAHPAAGEVDGLQLRGVLHVHAQCHRLRRRMELSVRQLVKHHRGDTPSWGCAPPLNHVPEGMRLFVLASLACAVYTAASVRVSLSASLSAARLPTSCSTAAAARTCNPHSN
jgi:hypothetical protein